MLIKTSDLTLSSTHELESSSTRELRLVAQPRAEASFGKLLRSRVQAVPAQLLAVGGAAQSAAGARKSPFEAVLEWLLGLTGAPSTAPALDGTGLHWRKTVLDDGGMAAADCVIEDFTGDGKPDIAAIGASTGNIKLYVNLGH